MLVFPADAERLTTRDQQRERRTGREELGQEPDHRGERPLDTIEHEEPPRPTELIDEPIAQWLGVTLTQPDGVGDSRDGLGSIVARGQESEIDVLKLGRELLTERQRQVGLADPSGARQGDEASVSIDETVSKRRQILIPADQRTRWPWHGYAILPDIVELKLVIGGVVTNQIRHSDLERRGE